MKKFFPALAAICATTFAINLAHAENIKPGLWEISTQTTGAGLAAIPAIPEAQRKQMESMGIKLPQNTGDGINVTTKTCITPEQAKQGVPPSVGKGQDKCTQSDIKTSGNTTTWKMTCSGQYKATGTGSVIYASPERFSGEAVVNVEQGPQGFNTLNNKFTGTFVAAECKQAK